MTLNSKVITNTSLQMIHCNCSGNAMQKCDLQKTWARMYVGTAEIDSSVTTWLMVQWFNS